MLTKEISQRLHQVLQHVCRKFQGIRQVPHLHRRHYAAAEGRVDQPSHGAVVTDTEDRNLDNKDSVMPLLI